MVLYTNFKETNGKTLASGSLLLFPRMKASLEYLPKLPQ